ncbi:hypothetical protein DICVIV_06317 [Dictyocaulus viviparus]|uniref:Uncharacterized protein n=1 Tax=Dictyocaulus viviparus TaxID=29172 RepID=A0A0D8XSU3_DICVI|nr:hypothetical protein DICVIV_06317 [Dictyocaulus viviparus]
MYVYCINYLFVGCLIIVTNLTMDMLSRIQLSDTDYLKRLALKKKSDNLCRLAAILDRAEIVLERFEHYFSSDSYKRTLPEKFNHALLVDNKGMEEYVVLDDRVASTQFPTGCRMFYGNTNDCAD